MKRTAEQHYLESSISTASQEELIVKIFDILITAATQSVDKLNNDRNDIEGIHRLLLRAQRALALLMGSLDMEIGGEIARNLFRIYEFWHHELVMANMQKDAARVSRILPHFKDYREMWRQAVTEFKQQQYAQAASQGHGFAAVG